MGEVLSLEEVWFSWGPEAVLRGVSLVVGRGDVVLVRGRSGVGKTTLARIAALILQPSRGEVVFQGRNASKMRSHERDLLRLRYIGYVDQFYRLIPHLTILENVALPLRLLGISDEKARKRAEEIMAALGIADIGERYPEEVSGGQRQRAAIARALVKRPELIVADEPVSNLDDETANRVLELLREYAEEQSAGVLITTTDPSTGYPCTREYILGGGVLHSV